jgi:hypothetical protein
MQIPAIRQNNKRQGEKLSKKAIQTCDRVVGEEECISILNDTSFMVNNMLIIV